MVGFTQDVPDFLLENGVNGIPEKPRVTSWVLLGSAAEQSRGWALNRADDVDR